jgi:hypothetical protein
VTAPPPGKPFSQVEPIAPMQRTVATASTGFPAEPPIEGSQEERQIRLEGLQEWIRELLLKNQQLRMALLEMGASEPGDGDGGYL